MAIYIGTLTGKSVASGGTTATKVAIGSNVVWENYVPTDEPLTFTAKSANSTVGIVANGEAPSLSLEYSTDGTNWSDYAVGDTITLANIDDFVSFRATREGNPAMGTGMANYNKFSITGTVEASGNANTLLTSNKNENPTIGSYCYYSLFKDCAGMTTAPEFPSTTIGEGGYRNLFNGCSSLSSVSIPDLKTVGTLGLMSMFTDCSALTYLDISGITSGVLYGDEFFGCSSLKKVVADGLSAVSDIRGMCNVIRYSESNDVALLVRNWSPAKTLMTGSTWLSNKTPSPTIVSYPSYDYYENNNGAYYTVGSPSSGKYPSSYEYPCRNLVPTKVLAIDCDILVSNGATIGYATPYLYLERVGNAPDIQLEWSTSLSSSTWTPLQSGANLWGNTQYTLPVSWSGRSATYMRKRFYIRVPHGAENKTFSNGSGYWKFYTSVALKKGKNPAIEYNNIDICGDITSLLSNDPVGEIEMGDWCFYRLFQNFTALKNGPLLPNKTLAPHCYEEMFSGCTGLKSVKLGYTGAYSSDYFNNWLSGVTSTGELIYGGGTGFTLPSNWTSSTYYFQPITFTATQANSTIAIGALAYSGSVATSKPIPELYLQYSTDNGSTWTDYVGPTISGSTYADGETLTLANIGDTIMMRAKPGKLNSAFGIGYAGSSSSASPTVYANSFNILGGVNVSGNINSLVSSEFGSMNIAMRSAPYKFSALFDSCTGIVDASNLVLPDIYVGYYAYQSMFWSCTGMTAGPDIWAKYFDTGYDQKSIDDQSMNMQYMFDGCSSLASLKMRATGTLPTATASASSRYLWVRGVASSGTFYYNGPTTTKNTSCIPTDWTITTF